MPKTHGRPAKHLREQGVLCSCYSLDTGEYAEDCARIARLKTASAKAIKDLTDPPAMVRKPLSRKDMATALHEKALAKPPAAESESGLAFWRGFATEAVGKIRSPRLPDKIEACLFDAGREAFRRGRPIPKQILRQIYGRIDQPLYMALVHACVRPPSGQGTSPPNSSEIG